MDDFDLIRDAWYFDPPADYRQFYEAGLLVESKTQGMDYSRFQLMSPRQIANAVSNWGLPRIKRLVPFAKSWGRDYYCWYVDPPAPPWTADCPRDSNIATGFASTFQGFIYRSLLEELADCWLGSRSEQSDRDTEMSKRQARIALQRNVDLAAPLLPDRWVHVLREAASRPLVETVAMNWQTITPAEAANIVERDLHFVMLNREFQQYL